MLRTANETNLKEVTLSPPPGRSFPRGTREGQVQLCASRLLKVLNQGENVWKNKTDQNKTERM